MHWLLGCNTLLGNDSSLRCLPCLDILDQRNIPVQIHFGPVKQIFDSDKLVFSEGKGVLVTFTPFCGSCASVDHDQRARCWWQQWAGDVDGLPMSCTAPRFLIRLHTQNCCLFVSGIVSLRQSGHSNFCVYLQKWLACCRLKELSMCTERLWTKMNYSKLFSAVWCCPACICICTNTFPNTWSSKYLSFCRTCCSSCLKLSGKMELRSVWTVDKVLYIVYTKGCRRILKMLELRQWLPPYAKCPSLHLVLGM